MEYILCAAIHFNDRKIYPHQPKNINIGFVLCGHRHGNCISLLAITGKRCADFYVKDKRMYVQGFLTNEGNFVNRGQAGKIAFEAKQIDEQTNCLFSEDLY